MATCQLQSLEEVTVFSISALLICEADVGMREWPGSVPAAGSTDSY